MVISELISANGLKYASERTLRMMRVDPFEKPVGLQIFGDDSPTLCKAAKQVEKNGADFVDLNLGCPVPKVVKKGGGAAMAKDVTHLFPILQDLVLSVRIPVSIKIRTGWDNTCLNAHEVVQAAYDAGISWVAVHGRTRSQGYSGLADWEFIGQIKAKAKLPIFGNGDILTAEQAVSRVKTYDLNGVYIGRAALKNPFIFTQARALWTHTEPLKPTAEDYLSLLTELRLILEEDFGPSNSSCFLQARKFCAWFASGFPNAHHFRKKAFELTTPDALWQEAHTFFSQAFADTLLDEDLHNPFLMGGHG
jgi:nifR3 family TIM-barrel protein